MRLKNNKLKKILLPFLCLLLALLLCSCSAGTRQEPLVIENGMCTIPGAEIRLKLPENSFAFSQASSAFSDDWTLAGIADPISKQKEYKEMGALANIVSMGGKQSMLITSKQSSLSSQIYDLTKAGDDALQEIRNDLLTIGETDGFTVKVDEQTLNGIRYATAEVDFTPQDDGSGREEMHEFLYVTIINGVSYTYEIYASGKSLTDEDRSFLDQIVGSAEYLNIQEKPSGEFSAKEILLALIPVLVIVLMIVLVIVLASVRKKKLKREKDELTKMLSAYRLQQKEEEEQGIKKEYKTLFVNKTVHTDANLQQFSYFHTYKKNLYTLPSFIIAGVLSLILAVLLLRDENYLWALLFAAAGVYCIVKIFTLPGQTYRTLQRVYKSLPNRVALYAFREEDFRLSGLQASGVFPYFQLNGVYESKDKIYLYFNESSAYIMDKATFSYGELDDFRAFIKERVGKRFHRRTL